MEDIILFLVQAPNDRNVAKLENNFQQLYKYTKSNK